MKPTNIALAVVIPPFLALSTWATLEHGYLGIFAVGWSSSAGAQVFADLCVSLFIATSWLKKDAELRGLNPWPWLVATPFLGSISPLFYLVYRQVAPRPVPAAA